jgi:hypothetical protein
MLPLPIVRRRLLLWWLIGGILPFAIIFLSTLPGVGAFGGDAETIWKWFATNFGTTLGTMLATVATDSFGSPSTKTVTSFLYRVMVGLSIFFLLMLCAPFILRPALQFNLIALLNNSKWWLGAVQSVLNIGMGAIFPKSK